MENVPGYGTVTVSAAAGNSGAMRSMLLPRRTAIKTGVHFLGHNTLALEQRRHFQ